MESFLNTVQKWLLIITIFLFPLFFLPTTQEFYITNKFYLLAAAVLLLLLFSACKFILTRKISLTKTPFDKILFALVLTRIISVILSSPNKIQALLTLPVGLGSLIVLALLYFIMVQQHGRKNNNFLIIRTLMVSSAIVGFVVILFFFNPLQHSQLPPYLGFLKNPSFSPVGNPLDTLYLLVFAGVFGAVHVIHHLRSTNKFAGMALAVFLITLVGTGLVIYKLARPVDQSQRLQLPPINVSWFAAVDSLKNIQTAATGVGLDNYESIFTLVKPLSYNLTDLWQTNFSLSRSYLLHIWVETGLLGLMVTLLLGVYIIREVHGLFLANDTNRYEYAALGLYLGLVIIFMPPSFIVTFLFVVFLAGLAERTARHDNKSIDIHLDHMPLVYIGTFAVSIAVLAGLLYLTARAYAAEYYFKKSIDAVVTNNGREVYNNLITAIRQNPFSERYHGQFSQINLLLANNIAQKKDLKDKDRQDIARLVQVAISEAKVTVRLNPQKVAYWNNLAVIYRNVISIAQGADAWTIASYRRAILQDPNNPILRLNLGGVYYALKNYEEAVRLFEQSVSLKPNWANAYYNLAWAQYQTKQFEQANASMEIVLRFVDKNSEDYKKAQENLAAFKTAARDSAATGAGELKKGQELNVATPPTTQVSPPLKLPQGTGPEEEIKAEPGSSPSVQPTPTPLEDAPSQGRTPKKSL